MRVLGHDPHLETWPEGIEQVALAELVAQSDVISVHVHLSQETTGLLSADLLAHIKPGAIVINTSRGAIIDEGALLAGLESGRIGAAGLDVLDGEPEIEQHPLVAYSRGHDNLIITPHIGGFSPDAVRVVCRRAAEKIIAKLGI
jgi:D-3-phosphoglycerate dehydrogenase